MAVMTTRYSRENDAAALPQSGPAVGDQRLDGFALGEGEGRRLCCVRKSERS